MLKMDTASSTYSSGQLTNLMSVDAQSVLEYSCYTHFIWATSLQVPRVVCKGCFKADSVKPNVWRLAEDWVLVVSR